MAKHEVTKVVIQLALHSHQHHSTLVLIYNSFYLSVIRLLKYLVLKIRVLRELERKLESCLRLFEIAIPYIKEVLECILVPFSNNFGETAVVLERNEPEGFDTPLAAGLVGCMVRERLGGFVILEGLLFAGFEFFLCGLSGAVDDRDTAIKQLGKP